MRIKLDIPLNITELRDIVRIKSDNLKNTLIYAISTNSEEIKSGDIFVALKGEKTSGELYTEEARSKGALVLSSNKEKADLYAPDTEKAFLKIASEYRKKLENLQLCIAITGSVGKTTTKNLLSQMLTSRYKVHATEGNFNNFIGTAYTLLSASCDTEILITELGMNHSGEISDLSKAVLPDISVITNAGTAHIGNLGSRENILNAKLEIIEGMKTPFLIVPNEERFLKSNCDYFRFSVTNNLADLYIDVKSENSNTIIFDLHTKHYVFRNITVPLIGRYAMNSFAAAISVLFVMKFSENEIINAIKRISANASRAKRIFFPTFSVYDDSYNASPEGVKAALTLSKYESGICSAILGDMLELGAESEKFHEEIGEAVFKNGYDFLYTFGSFAEYIAKGAKKAGMPSEKIFTNTDLSNPYLSACDIYKNLTHDQFILVKASHSVRAYRIITELEKIIKNDKSDNFGAE